MKEQVYATRDIRKGEPLTKAIEREDGYFYFFTADGSALRAPFQRKALTPEQRAQREKAETERRAAVEKRKAARLARREEVRAAAHRSKEAMRKQKQLAIDAKVAKLEEKKARL